MCKYLNKRGRSTREWSLTRMTSHSGSKLSKCGPPDQPQTTIQEQERKKKDTSFYIKLYNHLWWEGIAQPVVEPLLLLRAPKDGVYRLPSSIRSFSEPLGCHRISNGVCQQGYVEFHLVHTNRIITMFLSQWLRKEKNYIKWENKYVVNDHYFYTLRINAFKSTGKIDVVANVVRSDSSLYVFKPNICL